MAITFDQPERNLMLMPFRGDSMLASDGVLAGVFSPVASTILSQFEQEQTIDAEGVGTRTCVPYHAVLVCGERISSSEMTKADPYCQDTGGDTSTLKKLYLGTDKGFQLVFDAEKSDFTTPSEVYAYVEENGIDSIEIKELCGDNYIPAVSPSKGNGWYSWVINGTHDGGNCSWATYLRPDRIYREYDG